MKTCPDCGCRVYRHGCVNCDEDVYIALQAAEDQDWPNSSDKSSSREQRAHESAQVDAAVDPQATNTGTPTPRV